MSLGFWLCMLPCLGSSETPNLVDALSLPSTEVTVAVEGQGYFPVVVAVGQRIGVVLRGGGGHLGRGGRLDLVWSPDGGKTWTKPATIVDTPEDDRNPAVGVTAAGRLLLGFHHQGSYTPEGRYDPSLARARCMTMYSDDGITWSEPQPLSIDGLEPTSPYGRIVMFHDGTCLMNVYGPCAKTVPGMGSVPPNAGDYSYVVRSRDSGKTWSDPSLVAAGYNETALIMPRGDLVAAARSAGDGHLAVFVSGDAGYTWERVARVTDRSQHPADMITLSNGWILLVFGNRQEEKAIRGIVSRDGGRTWDTLQQIRFSAPSRGDFGYPSVVRHKGDLVLLHYWAGDAKDSYDGSKARAYATRVRESELLERLRVAAR